MQLETEPVAVLNPGDKSAFKPNKPGIFIVRGHPPYLWVGNNAERDKFCYATLDGKAALRKLARSILQAIGDV